MNKTKKYIIVTMFIAIAIVINIVENAFIPELPLGIRFGLANIMSLITISLFSYKEMLTVNIMRVTIASLIGGTLFGTRFLIAGGGIILSSISLIITNKYNCSIIFSSIISSLSHIIGQIIVVCIIYKTSYMMTLLPLYIISSIGTGILTGLISKEVLKRIRL